jgi:prepilin-type N-terminal cleavage/methylation domain-containing protein
MKSYKSPVGSLLRKGFTLIELLAVMAIIAILAAALVPQIPKWIDRANVTACSANMQELYKGFVDYKTRFGDWPNESGIRFFLDIWRKDPNSHDDTFAKRFTCPGVKPRQLAGIRESKPSEWFNDWEALDSTYTAYAGRDLDKFPNLDTRSGNEPIVADDNEFATGEKDAQPNHQYATVVLYADGSARPLDVVELRSQGVLGPNQYLVPGPDCPVEDLRKLRNDAPLSKNKKNKKN